MALHLQVTFGADEYSVERWRQFHSVDLYDELCRWLKTGRLDFAASLCCHFADVLHEKVVTRLADTLAMVPDEVVMNELCAWLSRGVVPAVLALQDTDLIDLLAAWLEKRACDMEVTQKQSWPMNAIQLCDILQSATCVGTLFRNTTPKEYACQIVGLAVPQTSLDKARQSQNALVRLRVLRGDLQRIIELRGKYNCSFSLAEFRSETVQSIAYRLLDRVVAVELITSAISNIVRPYAEENCLKLDELLSSYIEELVHRRGSGGMHVSAVWESKAVEILNSIANQSLCIRTLLAIVSVAQFPWNEDVSNAVKAALAKNPSHTGLKEQWKLASLKQLLINYDLPMFNCAEIIHSEDLAFYILMQDRETAVEDALAVTEVYSNVHQADVHLFRCRFLAERNRAEEIVGLLRGITVQTLLDDVCERFIRHSGKVLSDPFNNLREQYATAARHLLKLSTMWSTHCRQDLQDQLSDLMAVHKLDSEFGQFISVNDYCSTAKRQQFCDQCLNSLKDEDSGAPVKPISKNLAVKLTTKAKCSEKLPVKASQHQIAHILKMSPYDEVFQAIRAARDGNICTAVESAEHIVWRVAKNDVNMIKHVLRILKALCDSIEKGNVATVEDLTAIHRVSCSMVLTAPFFMVDHCLRVARSARLAVEMMAQCSSNNSVIPLSGGVDWYRQWTFDDYLSDDECGGLVMDTKSALCLAYAFVAATLPPADATCLPAVPNLQQIVGVAEKVTQLLTANSQTRLLLGYFLEVGALVGGVSELELNRAVVATLKQCTSQRRADHRLALTAALSVPHSFASDYLRKLARSAGIQYKKVLAIAQVGLAYTQLTHNFAGLSQVRYLVTEARWGYQLAKVHVSFHECFGVDNKKLLIPVLAASEFISVDDVLKYCQDFKLNVNEGLCLYLQCLLLPSSDSTVSIAPFSVVQQRVEETCHHIQPESLVNTLEKTFEKVSPYDYERLEFILDQLLSASLSTENLERTLETSTVERNKKLLGCLKTYRRVSPPSEDELLLDDIVKDRLPFHAMTSRDQNWRIITDELNADTVYLWIPMAAILHRAADLIYTTAVRNIVQSHVSQLPSRAQWSDGDVDTEFMEIVHTLLSRVTDIELAVACVSWIVHELPPGAERVVAYTRCVDLQERHVASCSVEQRSKAMHILEKHRLGRKQTAIEQVCFKNYQAHHCFWSWYWDNMPGPTRGVDHGGWGS